MKVILTGSLGHISQPLAKELVQKGYDVTVISSKPGRQKDIEALGAKAAIGQLEDAAFLSSAFTGADLVYVMVPPVNFFDQELDIPTYYERLGNNYLQAIRESGVKRVVHLSGIGGERSEGTGFVKFISYRMEMILKELPADVSITTIRPAGLFYNLFFFLNAIKTRGAMVSVYGGDEKEPWVAPADVAAAIAEEIEKPAEGRKVRYVAGDEMTPNELAQLLGEAIGKPGLKWITLPDEQWLAGLQAAGMNPRSAKALLEMNAAKRGGVLFEDYFRNKPTLGKVKLADFAKSFAAAFSA